MKQTPEVNDIVKYQDGRLGYRADGRPFMPWDTYAPGNCCNFCDGGDPDHCPRHSAHRPST